jgi:hypothetical protein
MAAHSYGVRVVIEIKAFMQRKAFNTGRGCLLKISRPNK